MPTYDYVCEECAHAFAEFHSMSQDPLVTCPSCEKDALRRLIGAGAGIIFKGSGFYETDYKRSRKGGESKTELKTEKKTEPKKADSGSS